MGEEKPLDASNECTEKGEFGSIEPFDTRLSWWEQFQCLGRSRRSALAALACSSAAILIGYDLTLIGSIIANDEFVKTFGSHDTRSDTWSLPANRQLVWSVVQYISAISGAFSMGFLNDIFGRRMCFISIIFLTTAGTLAELFSPNWKVWIVAKLLLGSAMGFMQGVIPTYVSELSPVHIRGFMLSLFQFWIILGSFLASCVLEGTSKIDGPWSWKAAIVSQLGIGFICLTLFIPLVPESPYFLMSKSKLDATRSALLRLRGSEPEYDVDADMEIMQATIEHERQSADADAPSYLDCFKGADRRRTLIACLPMVMQHFSGYPLCGNYLSYFLELSGLTDSFLITVISLLFSMFAVLLSFLLIEYVGRRPQLLSGLCGMIPCLLGISILGFVNPGTLANGHALAAVAIIWSIFYYLSVGAVGWTLVAEVSSPRLRAKTTSIAAMSNSLINMGFSIGIPYLINADEADLGPKAGLVFLVPCIIGTVLAFFVVPATKNKPFHELDRLFEAGTPARKF
ncbi:general substrate transporter [Aspergillus ellipticus CBS 707.79]|uniref:General substrate transporter n=1 Tax=Aspergillus ellipticus CBS 707.79 TaxID=1448320 RepID=A0A319EL07_9EURO|nr:general substrate transporter [Aspergillus ellipticus CBS 707.79]